MASLKKIEEEIIQLKERNKRVESDKSWETSFSRRGLLVLFTYFAIGFLLSSNKCFKPLA